MSRWPFPARFALSRCSSALCLEKKQIAYSPEIFAFSSGWGFCFTPVLSNSIGIAPGFKVIFRAPPAPLMIHNVDPPTSTNPPRYFLARVLTSFSRSKVLFRFLEDLPFSVPFSLAQEIGPLPGGFFFLRFRSRIFRDFLEIGTSTSSREDIFYI